jgi:hypothetical protein
MKMRAITNWLSAAVLAPLLGLVTLLVLIIPSEAQMLTPSHKAAPGPLAGAGLPVLVIAGGAYLVVRQLRRKR